MSISYVPSSSWFTSLSSNLFRMGQENPEYTGRLAAALYKEETEKDGVVPSPDNVISLASRRSGKEGRSGAAGTEREPLFRIILEGFKGRLKAFVEKDGERIDSPAHERGLPPEIAYLINFSHQEDMSVPLSIFLRKWGKSHILYYREGETAYRVQWSDNIPCTTWTEFDTAKDEVILRKVCSMGNEVSPAVLLGNFAFSPDRTRMCYVKERQGWELWNTMRDLCLREPVLASAIKEAKDWTLRIPKQVFMDFQFSFPRPPAGEVIPGIRFKLNGAERAPLVASASNYRISVVRQQNDEPEFVMRPECTAGDAGFAPSKRILSFH